MSLTDKESNVLEKKKLCAASAMRIMNTVIHLSMTEEKLFQIFTRLDAIEDLINRD